MVILLGIFAAPAIAFVQGLMRAILLFWPVMVGLGALHSYIPMVPPLGWAACFWLVFVLGLLIPTGGTDSSD